MNNKIKLLLMIFLVSISFVSCEDDEDYMKSEIVDVNEKIHGVDKEIVQPGDEVLFTGIDLDQVYKIMLNRENVSVDFVATATELNMTVPSLTPLGDVITVSLFFSGKGLAQRALKIISPPVIQAIVPGAGQVDDVIKVLGRELHLAKQVFVGDIDVTSSMEIIDDRTLTLVIPVGSVGGLIKIITETGGESFSSSEFKIGAEIMVNDFDGTEMYFDSFSNNGNIDDPITGTGDFVRGNYYQLPIVDKNSSWGGNFDIFFVGQPSYDNDKVSLSIDIKASKAMSISIMVQGPANVYGLTVDVEANWQTIVIPFNEMGSGYGNDGPDAVEAFNTLTTVKIQPPATSSSGNFGESVSIDNVKFVILN